MLKSKDLAVVLVSGGMDSLVCAAIAQNKHEELAFLHLNYEQKNEARELESFYKIAEFYKIEENRRKVIDVNFFKNIGGSSLVDENIDVSQYTGMDEEIPNSYVPFRNTHIIAMAVSWAEVIKAKKVYIGAVEEDSSGYPDCRPSYYEAYNKLIKEGTKEKDIEIITPVISFQKSEIILKAKELNAPLEYSYSCYARSDIACGICDSCALRLRGFEKAGLVDPIEYDQRPYYLNK